MSYNLFFGTFSGLVVMAVLIFIVKGSNFTRNWRYLFLDVPSSVTLIFQEISNLHQDFQKNVVDSVTQINWNF